MGREVPVGVSLFGNGSGGGASVAGSRAMAGSVRDVCARGGRGVVLRAPSSSAAVRVLRTPPSFPPSVPFSERITVTDASFLPCSMINLGGIDGSISSKTSENVQLLASPDGGQIVQLMFQFLFKRGCERCSKGSAQRNLSHWYWGGRGSPPANAPGAVIRTIPSPGVPVSTVSGWSLCLKTCKRSLKRRQAWGENELDQELPRPPEGRVRFDKAPGRNFGGVRTNPTNVIRANLRHFSSLGTVDSEFSSVHIPVVKARQFTMFVRLKHVPASAVTSVLCSRATTTPTTFLSFITTSGRACAAECGKEEHGLVGQ
ncbi:hypothetical protein C8F04DRAFT_1357627 [Mycena alexandri]|uniref:Uncharacterized protein n=1 Tax=Mycena alexandri TaxID=1745969 RepID=A0AAD6SVQ3_9AGAR|nr:hypothetical protein C8F04DRAFT_1357627 [Mycena alexandri]